MKRAIFIMVVLFLAMQLIQTDKTNPTLDENLEITAPENIETMFKNACYDCHSNQTKWPWYSSIAPGSWIIYRHVKHGRKALDFTAWENYSKEDKKKKLKAIYRTVYGSMPLVGYLKLHDEAILTKEQREEIRTWTGARPF